jgi:hypothetical protein
MILHSARDHVRWVCDSNLFIAPTDPRIWDALIAERGRLCLTVPIYHELKQWLDDPVNNSHMATEIKKSFDNSDNTTIQFLDFPHNNKSQITSLEYYINLLGMRKQALRLAEARYSADKGRLPTKQELSNYCKDNFGLRTQLLAGKGANAKINAHKLNDEITVVLAIADAIRTGRETVILTRDEDVYEQYYKCLWLIDTHYRAMLLAEKYAADPFAYHPARRIMDLERHAFEGEIILLRKPSDDLQEVLPAFYRPVPVHCILMTNEMIHAMFPAERGMADVLDVKGKTGGLSTDRLEGRNCHIYLGNRTRQWGNCAAIGHDISFNLGNPLCKLSIVDLNITTVDCEPVVRLKEVLPQLILLPSQARH